MENIDRQIDLKKLLAKSSYFLFGPRGVGKSFLIRHQLLDNEEITYINLLDSRVYLRLQNSPFEIAAMIQTKIVVVDEIQRIPELLNEVHRLIEEKGYRFLLTGSSARKLKRGEANLLAGRAFKSELFPFSYKELGEKFDLDTYLFLGGLPLSYTSENAIEYLQNYVDVYLKEEIQAESLVKNLPNYHRFLSAAAANNGQILNYSKVAADAQLSPNTVRDYYQILEDTLLGFQLEPWIKSKKRKAVQTSKFYFFDPGVTNAILQIESLPPQGELYGAAFEQFIACEIRSYLSYNNIRKPLRYWRSTSQFEVDFVVGDDWAIEVKAASRVTNRDHKGLKALLEEKSWKRAVVISKDPAELKFENGIEHLYWKRFLEELWAGEIF